jgi:hypothetical protein
MAMRLPARLDNLQSAVVCRRGPASHQPAAPLRTPHDVLALLERMTTAVLADPCTGTAAKARAVSRLAAVALRAIETSNLAARVEMLETVLKQRPPGGA